MKKKEKHVRPTWDEYFMSIADMIGNRATCARGRSGCVIVRDRQILVTGYVGSPKGMPHCDDEGHEMSQVINDDGSASEHCIRTVHAEQNAIAQAAKLGVPLDKSTLYCRIMPCYICAKIMANAGIIKVIAFNDYQKSVKSKKLFEQSGIMFQIINNAVEDYKQDRKVKHGNKN